MKKEYIKTLLSLGFGVGLCYWALSSLTVDEVNVIKQQLAMANYAFLAVSALLGFLAYVSRGLRWKYPLQKMGYNPRKEPLVAAVSLGYLLNLTIPRSGEVARAMALQHTEDIPFNKSIGTIITERVIDFCFILFFIMLTFFVQFNLFKRFLLDRISLEKLSVLFVLFILFFLTAIYVVFKINNKYMQKLKEFILGIKEGVLSVFTLNNPWWFIGHTLFIWSVYFCMFYIVFFALPATSQVSLGDALMAFVVGSFAVIFTNGGLGAYPIMVAQVLTLYGVDYPTGTALGWLIWTSQFAMTLLSGSISILVLSYYKK